MKWENMVGGGNGGEEKIFDLVWLRSLSEKEISRNEVSDWECINEIIILYRNNIQERSGLPIAYSFDGVFNGGTSLLERCMREEPDRLHFRLLVVSTQLFFLMDKPAVERPTP